MWFLRLRLSYYGQDEGTTMMAVREKLIAKEDMHHKDTTRGYSHHLHQGLLQLQRRDRTRFLSAKKDEYRIPWCRGLNPVSLQPVRAVLCDLQEVVGIMNIPAVVQWELVVSLFLATFSIRIGYAFSIRVPRPALTGSSPLDSLMPVMYFTCYNSF